MREKGCEEGYNTGVLWLFCFGGGLEEKRDMGICVEKYRIMGFVRESGLLIVMCYWSARVSRGCQCYYILVKTNIKCRNIFIIYRNIKNNKLSGDVK